jgi:hypothetical protein
MGKLKRSHWRVGSAPYGCGRASISGERSGSASRGQRLGLQPEEEDDPGGSELGRVHWAQRPTGPVSVKDRKNGGGPHEGMGRNQRIKKNGLFKWFWIYLGFRIQKQRIQNIFKLKFELGYTKINLNKLFRDFQIWNFWKLI